MSASVRLDHIGVAIRDLERGRRAYERLGFTLTPRSIHRGAPTPGAPVQPYGSGNHCAMFQAGYLEVVGLTDPTIYSNVKALVARYEGAHIVAFGVDSAEAVHAELSDRGIPIEAARALERDAAYGPAGKETRRAAFRNLYFDQTAYPEARLLYIEHVTPDVLWQPHLIDHPNGVVALSDVFLRANDARAVAEKYSELFGAPAEGVVEGEWRIALARGRVWIVTPDAWRRRALAPIVTPVPGPVGIGFRVRSIADTRSLLSRNELHVHETPDAGVWVDAEYACGVALHFSELSAGGSPQEAR